MEEREIKLSLDPSPQAPDMREMKKDLEGPTLEEVPLSPDERRQVEDFAKKIDLTDSSSILEYGAGAQGKIASFSEKTLSSVQSKDLGEVGDLLSHVVTELKTFDQEEKKGVFGLFQKTQNKAEALRAKYAKAETNVESIAKSLEGHQIQLLKDIANLDQMYDLNLSYYKELSMYILAGRKRLERAYQEELPRLEGEAQNSQLPVDAQRAQDFRSAIERFEKKLHDLDLTRMVSLQMAPQIRMIQSGDTVMVEKLQSTLANTIPLWKSQMVLALGVLHTSKAAQAQKEVTDFTNDLLRKNAEALKMSSVETAKASQRSIIDLETIRHTNDQLISAITEIRQIQRDGAAQRSQASHELRKLEEELKQGLLQAAKGE